MAPGPGTSSRLCGETTPPAAKSRYLLTPMRRNDPFVSQLHWVVGVVDPGLSAVSDRLLGDGEEQSSAPGGEAADDAARGRRLSPTEAGAAKRTCTSRSYAIHTLQRAYRVAMNVHVRFRQRAAA